MKKRKLLFLVWMACSVSFQYVSAGRLGDILQVVSDRYRNSSVDMNLTFEPATADPQGKPMNKPGVEYIEMMNIFKQK